MAAPLPELSGATTSAATRRRQRQALLLGVGFGLAALGAGLAVHRLYQTAEREVREQSELARRQAVAHARNRIAEETERLRNTTLKALAALHSEGLAHALQRWDANDTTVSGTFQWDAAQGFSPDAFPQHPHLALTEMPALWQSAKLNSTQPSTETSLGAYHTRTLRTVDNPAFPAAELGYQAENIEIVTYAGGRAQPLAGWAAHARAPEMPWIFWYRVGPDAPVRGCFVDLRSLLARLQEELLDTRLARVSLSPASSHEASPVIADLAGSLPGYVLKSAPGDLFVEKHSATRLTALTAGGVLGVFILGAVGLVAYARREMREAEQKATFVTHVSHELRTPLTSIRMFADMLTAPEVPAEKRAKFAGTISRESARLGTLIERLLTFNALEKGKHAVALAPVDVTGVVRETLEEMDSALRASGLQVETELPAETVIATTDRGTLKQALLNLLDNAQKYARSGGSVRVSLQTQPEQVRVRVADAGPGIARGLGAKIFDPFVQGGRTLTDKTPGIGLGLSIARGLLRAAGGDVVLLPSERGATFEIRLPRTLSS